MTATAGLAPRYDPRAGALLTFQDAVARFLAGDDSPSAYLERCLMRLAEREPSLRAFAITMPETARQAAAASSARYRVGAPLSPIDGMPLAIKDIFETRDVPTSWGVAGLAARPGWRDAAVVDALRRGGAVLVGKTHLPELGLGAAPPTTNPWDATRSPGGSSSGSAAAVGAALLPAAIATQGRGSLTRPASYCGVYGYKPSHGAIHRGGDGGGQETNTHIGAIAGSLADSWILTRFLSDVAGPHPGSFGLEGPVALPPARRPHALIRLDGAGWTDTEPAVRASYEQMLASIAARGVAVRDATEEAATRALAADLAAAGAALGVIADYESRWPYVMHLRDAPAGLFAESTKRRGLARAEIPRAAYHDALRCRAEFQRKLASCEAADLLFVSPAATGPAPLAAGGSTGSSIYQLASSLAGNPVLSLPLLTAEGLPLGLQLQGFFGGDATLMALARWLDESFHRGEI